MFRVSLGLTLTIYLALCFSTNYYFGPRVVPIITLDWQDYTGGVRIGLPISWWARLISTAVLCFPVITVSAAFPLNILPLADTLYKLLPSTDTSVAPAPPSGPRTQSPSRVLAEAPSDSEGGSRGGGGGEGGDGGPVEGGGDALEVLEEGGDGGEELRGEEADGLQQGMQQGAASLGREDGGGPGGGSEGGGGGGARGGGHALLQDGRAFGDGVSGRVVVEEGGAGSRKSLLRISLAMVPIALASVARLAMAAHLCALFHSL